MEDKTITIDKVLLAVLGVILAGVSSFTGYELKPESRTPSSAEIKEIMRGELRSIELQANSINNQVSVIIYRQTEFERRLEQLEVVSRNVR